MKKLVLLLAVSIVLGLGSYAAKLLYQFGALVDQLTLENANLSASNRALVKRQKGMAKKVRSRNKATIASKVKRAERKILRAAPSMVPVAGIPVIVGLTALEVQEYCQDIIELKAFERDLLMGIESEPDNQQDDNTEQELEMLCGMDVEKELKPIADEQLDDARKVMEDVLRSFSTSTLEAVEQLVEVFADPDD